MCCLITGYSILNYFLNTKKNIEQSLFLEKFVLFKDFDIHRNFLYKIRNVQESVKNENEWENRIKFQELEFVDNCKHSCGLTLSSAVYFFRLSINEK